MLAVAVFTVIFGSGASYGLSFLIPALRNEGMALGAAAALVVAPVAGIVFTLVAWGAAADRWGDRRVLSVGPMIAAAGLFTAAVVGVDGPARWVALFVAGAGGASVFSASGRMVFGWFGPEERGMAIGVRHAGQPVGIALAAVTLPVIAANSTQLAFVYLATTMIVSSAVVATFVRDVPHRAARAAGSEPSPYRGSFLYRLHAASCLLVVPQFAISVFAFDYLVNVAGWSIEAAGSLTGGALIFGAACRLVVGYVSDRLANRLRLVQVLSIVIGATMFALAIAVAGGAAIAAGFLFIAGGLTVSPNALAFTAVAERAGIGWAGRALGIQNTLQHIVGAAVPIGLAMIIDLNDGSGIGYAAAFGATVVFPLTAAALTPARQEVVPS